MREIFSCHLNVVNLSDNISSMLMSIKDSLMAIQSQKGRDAAQRQRQYHQPYPVEDVSTSSPL